MVNLEWVVVILFSFCDLDNLLKNGNEVVMLVSCRGYLRALHARMRTTMSTTFFHGATVSACKPVSFWQEKLHSIVILG